jgi:hypothetical protein
MLQIRRVAEKFLISLEETTKILKYTSTRYRHLAKHNYGYQNIKIPYQYDIEQYLVANYLSGQLAADFSKIFVSLKAYKKRKYKRSYCLHILTF